MTLLEIEKEINLILNQYETAENKQELDKRLDYLRSILSPRETKQASRETNHDKQTKVVKKETRGRKPTYKPKRSAHTKRYKKYLKVAKKNGIIRNQYYRRTTRLGWDYKDAATIPVNKYRKREKLNA